MAPVVGKADGLTPCHICHRPRVMVQRASNGRTVVLCLACDPGPLADKVLAELEPRHRRSLHL